MIIPNIGLGTYRMKGSDAIDAIRTALQLGYRHIDTAQLYENETEVGRAIATSGISRDDIFVTTKVWIDKLGRNSLIPSLKESLEKLALPQVDLVLVHWPSPNSEVPVQEYMEAIAEAKSQGLTKLIGVSNFTIEILQQAIDAVGAQEIATNQIEVHPFLQNKKLIDFAHKQGIHITAYMPLAVGKVMEDPVLIDIGERHKFGPAQIALAWLLQQGLAVIPSSTKRFHLELNLQAQDIKLSAEEMDQIAGLDQNYRIANPDFAPKWD
ncbi:MAG: 2,5-didehydrogluconate reductase DkgB [Gammaproteobacteria bacterium]|nr:MAG: 2,5-didehydrogluconate reductase DkgB [Gammaproteobacteria bacterium]